MKANIGLIGLAVMGQNLVLNMNDHGFKVAVYNRTTSAVDEFLADAAKGTQVIGTHSLEELVDSLESPRIVMLMVKAGEVVDAYIEKLVPLLSAGDIIVDGGNSLFTDTNRRTAALLHKILCISARVFQVVKKAREMDHPSCQAVTKRHGLRLNLFFRRSAHRLAVILAANGSAIMARVIMSKWCITALNTAICS